MRADDEHAPVSDHGVDQGGKAGARPARRAERLHDDHVGDRLQRMAWAGATNAAAAARAVSRRFMDAGNARSVALSRRLRRAPRWRPVLNGQHAKHFQWKHGTDLDSRGTVAGACATPEKEGRMAFILAIMTVPLLTATGIYNPPVMRHGQCIAEPGSFAALYCPAPEAPARRPRRKR